MISKTIGMAAVMSLAIVPFSYAQDAAPAEQEQQTPSVAGQPQDQAQQPDQAQGASETVQSGAVTDAEVESFARAYIEIRQVQDEIKQGGDAAAGQAEATEKMNAILEDHDLSVERYNQIARSIASDQALMQRIQAKMAEIQAETSGAPTSGAPNPPTSDAPGAPSAPDSSTPQ
jgi:hypothetical protein